MMRLNGLWVLMVTIKTYKNMKHVLIQLEPLQLTTTNINGFPQYREVGDPTTWRSPEGYIYVPVLAEPQEEPATGKVWVRNLTATEYGWVEADLEEVNNAYNGFEITGVTKYTIMKRLQYLGKWMTFKGVLSTLPEEVQDAWSLALEIKPDDPMFVENKPALCAVLELTEQQLDDVLDPYSGMPEGEIDPTI